MGGYREKLFLGVLATLVVVISGGLISSTTLFPPIPQLPTAGTEYTEAQIFWIAKHGIRRAGMFANGKWDSDEKRWTVAAFIKRIKSLPPPKIASGT